MIRVVLTIHCLEIQALSALPTKPHSVGRSEKCLSLWLNRFRKSLRMMKGPSQQIKVTEN